MTPPRDSRGFTLIELVIALAISGMVVLAARALVVAVAEANQRLEVASAEADAAANGERLLRGLVGRLDVSAMGSRFQGVPTAMSFPTWCDAPGGGLEPCNAGITVQSAPGSAALVASLAPGVQVTLLRGRAIALRYLESAAGGGVWFERWGTSVSVPLAIAVIVDRDTLMVRLGTRGVS